MIMDSKSSIFSFHGSEVTFKNEDGTVMVNATEMAKHFGKTPKDWTRTKQSQEFINSLSAVRQICITGLIIVKQGGNGEQGTWMHEDVAIEFARWLNPVFAIWCNDRIKELLTKGSTSLNIPKTYQEALRALADEVDRREKAEQLALESSRIAKQERAEKETAIKTLEEKQPDIDFANSFEQATEGSMLVREVAKRLTQNGAIIRERNLRLLLQKWNFFTKTNSYELTKRVMDRKLAEYRHYKKCVSGYDYEGDTVYVTPKGYKEIVQAIIGNFRKDFLDYGGSFSREAKLKLGIIA